MKIINSGPNSNSKLEELLKTDMTKALELLYELSPKREPLEMVEGSLLSYSLKAECEQTGEGCPLCLAKDEGIKVLLNEREYFIKCPPTPYFENHLVVSSTDHRPLTNSLEELSDMLELATDLVGMSVASNCGLERIGGSIKEHCHFQVKSGTYKAMEAPLKEMISNEHFIVGTLDWYIPSIVIKSIDKRVISTVYERIYNTFLSEKYEVLINGESEHHNAFNPLVYFDGTTYTLILFLRSNVKKDGIYLYDTNPKDYIIKSSGIGVIEVSGHFVLDSKIRERLGELYSPSYILDKCLEILSDVSITNKRLDAQEILLNLISDSHIDSI